LKAEFNGDGKGYLRKMQSIDMLMMDDVGKEKQTDWSRSIMFDVVNYRYEHILPIVITTNLTTKQLAEYFGDAVWSRLCEMCRGAQMSGSDYRRLQ
jgi:DNA replication protein DnaC